MFAIFVVMLDETFTLQKEKRKCERIVAMDSDSQMINLRTDDETTHPLNAEQPDETSFHTGQYCLRYGRLVVYTFNRVCVNDHRYEHLMSH